MFAVQPPEPPEVDYRRPAWIQPLEDVILGGARGAGLRPHSQRAIGLTGIRAYLTGFA